MPIGVKSSQLFLQDCLFGVLCGPCKIYCKLVNTRLPWGNLPPANFLTSILCATFKKGQVLTAGPPKLFYTSAPRAWISNTYIFSWESLSWKPFLTTKSYGRTRLKVLCKQIKVQIFWEGHKNLAHLPLFIWHYFVASNYKRKKVQNVWILRPGKDTFYETEYKMI